MIKKNQPSPSFIQLTDLAAERMRGEALACSDDFFAPMVNLVMPGRGIFIEDKFTDRGKWMDGWESRRRRSPGHDWCILKLGAPGVIRGLDIDTNHFLGNHPPHASVEACCYDEPKPNFLQSDNTKWTEILRKSPLEPGSQNFFEVTNDQHWTHVRLNIYPDGGVARIKVYGEVHKNWDNIKEGELIDLANALNGGRAILCNDMFFSHMDNLIMPGRSENMGDGWETKRNRNPDNVDWVIIKLARPGRIEIVIVDTHHFKGNNPDSCSLEGCNVPEDSALPDDITQWTEILPKTKLEPDNEHYFEKDILNNGPFTHVRLNIFPDGGVSRLRLFG
ncbi:MAG: allantoicase [Bacteroidetes bacterium]|nr:allantoicase [Bacteroidota bacterium]